MRLLLGNLPRVLGRELTPRVAVELLEMFFWCKPSHACPNLAQPVQSVVAKATPRTRKLPEAQSPRARVLCVRCAYVETSLSFNVAICYCMIAYS